jgi:riboflavin synthase
MFTGIVEELGQVLAVELGPDSARLHVHGARVTQDAAVGSSIAVNGVCLTVTETASGAFVADVMAETLARSSLGELEAGSPVNLERPVAPSGRLGGHIVQGHVDGVGVVLDRTVTDRWELVRIGCPSALVRYLVEKGSVAVDGVSLTVVRVHDPQDTADPGDPQDEAASFTVSLIPQTLTDTTLGRRAIGQRVNLEVDVLAKYVERLLRVPARTATTSTATTGTATTSRS